MERDDGATLDTAQAELARLTEERHALFARLIELESERTAQTMELFTMAAHELRTPLQSLIMVTDLMIARVRADAEALDPDWLKNHLELQQRTLERMEELMQSWLAAPELRAGTMPSVLEHFDLAKLVREVVARHERELSWAGCVHTVALAAPIDGEWDRLRIDAVLSNLLSNAMKYGAGKPIAVELSATDECARIVVRDEGIGIASADQERIFDRFERAGAPSRVAGFGIGLWMARALLSSIDGTLSVESVPGAGSAFTIELARVRD